MANILGSWREYLAFAVETAWQAGQLTLGYFQTGLRPDLKADESPVTVADREAEQLIRERIGSAYPGHAVAGEEYGEQAGSKSSFRWLIDPIDGTRSYVRGVPLYAVLLALEVDGEVQVGVAHFPALGEMVAAATGEGCWWNGRRARVSEVSHWREAVVAFTDTVAFAPYGRAAAWERFQACGATLRGWSDAYGHMLVATGRAEVMLDPIMNAWDCGPFAVILREAGGYFGDWQGQRTIYGHEALSCNAALLEQALALVAGEGVN
jgi:histidinol-phosphatase